MPVTNRSGSSVVELSTAEQWVVHHVLLDSIGLADGEHRSSSELDAPRPSLTALEKVESGAFDFDPAELAFLRRACDDHARYTEATADRNLASAVADRIDGVLRDTTV